MTGMDDKQKLSDYGYAPEKLMENVYEINDKIKEIIENHEK